MKTGGEQGKSHSEWVNLIESSSRMNVFKVLDQTFERGYILTEQDVPKIEDSKKWEWTFGENIFAYNM